MRFILFFSTTGRATCNLDHLVGLRVDNDRLAGVSSVDGGANLHHSHGDTVGHVDGHLLTTDLAEGAAHAAPSLQEDHETITLDADLFEGFHGVLPDAEQIQQGDEHSAATAKEATGSADGIVDLTGGEAREAAGDAEKAASTGFGAAIAEASVEVTRLEHHVLRLGDGGLLLNNHLNT